MRGLPFIIVMTACGPGVLTATSDAPAMVVVEGAASDGNRPTRKTEAGSWSNASALWVQGGQPAVLDAAGPHLRDTAGTFSALPVGEAGTMTLGTVTALTPRGTGVLLAGASGLFVDQSGRLLPSPMNHDFTAGSVRFLDLTGDSLWVTTDEAVQVSLANATRAGLVVDDAKDRGAVQLVAGRTSTTAVLVQGTSLYGVDLSAQTVTTLAREVGTVSGVAHLADGTVALASSRGLLVVARDGVVTRHTLSAAGAEATPVLAVTTAADGFVALTATQVVRVGLTGAPTLLTEVSHPSARGLATDGTDFFVLDGAELARLTTQADGSAPSFARDVAPFMTAHCQTCHASGAQYAPVRDFTNFGVAKTNASLILRRLRDTAAPMPPAATEVLTSAQYDVVVRWVNGGFAP
jgi:mono/diheme cytochrome c family protein